MRPATAPARTARPSRSSPERNSERIHPMPKPPKRLTTAVLSAFVALLLVPAVGEAATNFGSRMKNDPTDRTCEALGTCTIVSFNHPSEPNGDDYTGGAPVDGVITKFRIRAYAVEEPGQVTFRLGS